MYTEDDLLPLSGLQHLQFCERQWALIHLEGLWEENRLTVEGRQLHERVDENEVEVRGNTRIVRGLRLRSLHLGLAGRADVVEFERVGPDCDVPGVTLPGLAGRWRPTPVEYKRGRPKRDRSDEVQLCAQALCLEEMLETAVPLGVLFYGKTRRRVDVPIDEDLRQHTRELAAHMHALFEREQGPPPHYEKRCENCSLMAHCMPKTLSKQRDVKRYLQRAWNFSREDEEE
ncbi:MAG: CRISPR-associated protein Cas4 [Nitrospiraceae bacterium]|nr:CRISPR-associated protein Cas4 [Nitrospiraceae bacterium]